MNVTCWLLAGAIGFTILWFVATSMAERAAIFRAAENDAPLQSFDIKVTDDG